MKKEIIKKRIICITGATASGKSSLALKKTIEEDGEIISVDSRQIYKNISVFSGISKEDYKNHMVGFLNEWESFSSGDFVKMAEEKVKDIFSRGKTPILVGGTSFYFESFLYKNFLPEVPIDKVFRKKMEGKTATELMTILEKKSKDRADMIDKKNIPRIIRSIEIINSLGYFPEYEKKIRNDFDIDFLWIELDREEQKKNIDRNFRTRIQNGFLKEAENLKKILEETVEKSNKTTQIFPLNIFLKKRFQKKLETKIEKKFFDIGLAYKHIFKLWRGEITQEKFVELGILEEQKYAKRQNTYLKKFFNQLQESEFLRKEKINNN